jgi:predicted alpha-1,2-mannosidase
VVGSAALVSAGVLPGAVTAHEAAEQQAATVTDPAALVNPFIGTENLGNTFPGPDMPFGMVQWSPDTPSQPDGGGYDYHDKRITGFSLTHLSGPGCKAEGDVSVLPTVGAIHTAYTVGYSHARESAQAGYYRVGLDNGVNTQLTATTRTGMGSFGYPTTGRAHLIFRLDSDQKATYATTFRVLNKTQVTGTVTAGDFCDSGTRYTLHFVMEFNHRITGSGTFSRNQVDAGARSLSLRAAGTAPGGQGAPANATEQPNQPAFHGPLPRGRSSLAPSLQGPAGAYLNFSTKRGTPLLAKVGLSYVSTPNARINLNSENPGWNFGLIQSRATAAWNALLGKIQITGGTTQQQQVFYTALYHALLYPSVFSDVNGQYRGADGRIHHVDPGHTNFYTNISGWDIYRTQAQLEALLDPQVASDTAESMIDVWHQTGMLPKWMEDNGEAYIMVGDPADSILADYYAFGARDFNTSAALTAMVNEATRTSHIRPGGHDLAEPGYLPYNETYGCCNFYGSDSTTLEYDTADFSISAFAAALGNGADQHRFVDRAQDWRNVLNPDSGMDQPRNANGTWTAGFSPVTAGHSGFVEGDSWIYTGEVPFDLAGLAGAMGGDTAMAAYLNTTLSNFTGAEGYSYLGDEPSIELPWEYDYIGQPWQTQATIRKIQDQIWTDTPSGLSDGNDDLGTMSAWYVWSALGLYPMTPGTSTLAIGSPLFQSAVVSLPSGGTLTIDGNGAATGAPYVQSATFNGAALTNDYLPAGSLTGSPTLDFQLGTTPNTWGSSAAEAPPSYGGNVVAAPEPRVGPVPSGLGSGGLCLNVRFPNDLRASAVATWTCNTTSPEEWTAAPDGTVRALGKCLDVHDSGTRDGTPIDLYTCNGSGAQQWRVSAGRLENPQSGKCLNVPGARTSPGTALELYSCDNLKAQQWKLPAATATEAGAIVSKQSPTLCVDDKASSVKNGAPIQIYTCHGGGSQHWTVESDGTLRVLGKCLDVHNSGTTPGTPIDLYSCNSTNAQQWTATQAGELVSRGSGLCLNDPSPGVGTRLDLSACTGATRQLWTLPS